MNYVFQENSQEYKYILTYLHESIFLENKKLSVDRLISRNNFTLVSLNLTFNQRGETIE